ncbi:MAG: hypothetical protein KGM43_01060 [Planctomycetota bacterium]|nr:hypothetical protein [Planctomycetota bacterium]
MEPQRRVRVAHGRPEDHLPEHPAEPSRDDPEDSRGPLRVNVVAPVDRLEERRQVFDGRRFERRRDQHQRQRRPRQAAFERPRPAVDVHRLDHNFGCSFQLRDRVFDRLRELFAARDVAAREHDRRNARAGHRVALEVSVKRVDRLGFDVVRHADSRSGQSTAAVRN